MDYLQEFKSELKKFKVKKSFKENIEPEEILLDAQKQPEFSERKLETPLKNRVLFSFFGIILLGLLILVSQAGFFQIFKGNDYSQLAENNSLRIYPVLAPRGLIYDRNLETFVSNLPSFDVFLSPQDLPREKEERDTMIEQISFLLELNPKEVSEKLLSFDFGKEKRILLASNLTTEKALELESREGDFPALDLEGGVVRQYLFGDILSHVLGYTGKISQEEINLFPDYFLSERIGKSGLEAQYEKVLRGQAGERQVEVDAEGRKIKELGTKDSVPGNSIVTTIDLGLQEKMFKELSGALKRLNLSKALAVAINPENGQVLGMVSLPSFDSNLFEQSIAFEDLKKIVEDPGQPFFNRAIMGQYASGSVIKPMIGAAALQEKVVTPSTTVNDTGSISVVNQYNPDIVYVYPDWKAHGLVNMYSAIAQSCDVYFYTIGGGYGKIDGLGIDRIDKYLKLFGFGEATGIDLPGEEAGLVPTSEWKQKSLGEQWFLGDTYHVSIGQGYLLVTPLQEAMAVSSIANGGRLFQPYLVDKIIDSDKNSIKVFQPQLVRENFIDSQNIEVIREGMREAVTSGTAKLLADLPVEAAAKTGTAQLSGQANTNAWFVAFAPYDNPQIVLAVMLENAGEGSSAAAPVAKEILKWYFK